MSDQPHPSAPTRSLSDSETACAGHLFGIGLGPGDPDLMTRAAVTALASADTVAFFAGKPGSSIARRIAENDIPPTAERVEMVYPTTTGTVEHPGGYRGAMNDFYDHFAGVFAAKVAAGQTVCVISEGDPMFYGSYQHLHRRLVATVPTTVIPGVPSFIAAASALGTPLVEDKQVLTVMPGTLPTEQLKHHLSRSDAAVVMKLGRNAASVADALTATGVMDRALYAERVGHEAERFGAFGEVDTGEVPYMALAVMPGVDPASGAANTPEVARDDHLTGAGEVVVVGLGPGPDEWMTDAARQALAEARHIVGYATYLQRVPPIDGQSRHASDNTDEDERARFALTLARAGDKVAVVSSGDPGIFAMAAAVVEVAASPEFSHVRVRVEPGVSAAQAAAARVGAPLGHDLAFVSLSDRLKPWSVVERRLRALADADIAMALYNPSSRSRGEQCHRAFAVLREHLPLETVVVLAKSIGRAGEDVQVTTLGNVNPGVITMAHLVIVGTSHTHAVQCAAGVRVWTSRRFSEVPS